MTSVLLLENIHESASDEFSRAGIAVERAAAALAGPRLSDALAGHALIGIRSATHLGEGDIEQAPHLLAIGCFCIGTSQVDLAAAAARGIPVFNAPFSNTRSVAELVIAEAVLLLRRIPEKNALAHSGGWAKSASGSFETRGKTIAIVGYGNIGAQVGVLAEAMGMRVVFYDVQAKLALGSARAAPSLPDALSQADVVTLHVPATASTERMIDARALAQCKRGAILINASRGSVVDIDALRDALERKHLAGAAIDVFPKEPKHTSEAFASVLQGLPNVILTPHIGGSTEEAQLNIGVEVSSKLVAYVTRGDTSGAVNFPQVSPGQHCAAMRLVNVHHNVPGALANLNGLLAHDGLNIVAQHLQTRNEVGYVVTDIDKRPSDALMQALANDRAFVRTRLLPAT
ncbi:phosphoglycerate dehydrogenase [Trinickia acidisoli]|uniref:phosphoglycerate dehydrogenase n=1 Tax=Trinickia acidisoli TaxID=2767482 RepID=UPI001A8E97C1|nr:phosphoglycerate dehydrogenase [Trinickia acidisoli]